MNNGSSVFTLLFFAAILLLVLFSRKSDPEAKRRKDLAALAQKLHLRFNPGNDCELAEKFSFLSWLRRGDVRYAYNVFHGCHLEYPVTIFDYHFSTPGGGKSGGYDYYWSAFVVEMKTNFPDMIISHESRESRLAEALGGSHIAFESAEFTRAFRVRSSDKKFAYDVCHPKMMEYLLANQDLTVEISGAGLAVLFEDWLRPEKIEANLSRLIEIRKLLPDYLFAKTDADTGVKA
jgi:hypothetical protein